MKFQTGIDENENNTAPKSGGEAAVMASNAKLMGMTKEQYMEAEKLSSKLTRPGRRAG